ncbi:MAG: hypothetical protein ACJAYX_001020 [Planctomycetota bacterium]|jgi:hypothetical protein
MRRHQLRQKRASANCNADEAPASELQLRQVAKRMKMSCNV